MARFSLSPKSSSLGTAEAVSKESLDSESSDGSLSDEPIESESETESEEEEEAHPLGFSNHGGIRRRIGLIRGGGIYSPPTHPTAQPPINGTPSQQGMTLQREEHSPKVIHYFLQTKTPVLLKHHVHVCLSDQALKNDNTALVQNYLESLSINHNKKTSPTVLTPVMTRTLEMSSPPPSSSYKSPLQAIQDLKRYEREIQLDITRTRQQMEENQRLAVQSFKQLLQQDEREAARILERERQVQKEQEHLFAQEEKELEDKRLEELSKLEENKRLEEEHQKRLETKLQLQREEEERIQLEYAQKNEYITKAYSMVDIVKNLRQELEMFEKNSDKIISKRRLEMKKIARGKLNTLSHDHEKIYSVAQDVVRAVQTVIQEDADIRQRVGSSPTIQDTTLLLGASYFMDLIASNVIVRIQAEGFNGPRGDGFPLAIFLAMVSTQLPEEFMTLLQSHIYMVCPTAIPSLPKPLPGSSEVELMESLGMIQDKNGTYESFDRFLGRTEGIISMVGAIMASLPDNHKLFGGKEAALQWLQRFMDLLPEKGNPLPLLTAPVLFSFLTATGHMLALSYHSQFQSQLEFITGSILPRLDESTIGQPSATRLKKLLAGGMNGFISEVPIGALPELYNISVGIPQIASNTQVQDQSQNQRHNLPTTTNTTLGQGSVFNTMTSNTIQSSMETIHQGTQSFPLGSSNQSFTQDRFPTSQFASANIQVSPFSGGGTMLTNQQQSPFGQGASPFSSGISPFGVSQSSQIFGSQPSQSSQVFGSQPSPFGAADTTKHSAFSGGSMDFGTVSHPQPTMGIFGSTGSTQTSSNTSAFGSGSINTSFGSPSPFSNPTPFGASKNITSMNSTGNSMGFSTIGNPARQSNTPYSQTPFSNNSFGGGNSTSTQSNSFGNTNNSFGNTNTRPTQLCKFFQQGKCRNGDYCKFSHSLSQDSAAPFSRASPNQYASPFGAPRR